MRNISDKRCRETQNIYFSFSNFFGGNILSFTIQCKKIWYSRTGHRR